MSDKSNLLMFGATGTIGKYIIEAIVNARDSFGRIAIFTSPNTVSSKADELNVLRQKGVDILIGDVGNREDVLKAYAGTLLPQSTLPLHMHLDLINYTRGGHRHLRARSWSHRSSNSSDPTGQRNPQYQALRAI